MSALNQFLAWATAGGANALSPAAYAARSEVLQGVVNGVGDPELANTTWRQSSTIATTIAQFIADNQTADVLDNGNIATLEAQFKAALVGYLSSQFQEIGGFFAVASGTDAYTATLSPVPASLTLGMEILVLISNTNTSSSPTLNLNGFGAKQILKSNGNNPSPSDISGFVSLAFDNSGNWRLVGLALSDVRALIVSNNQTRIVANTTLYVDPATGNDTTGTGTSGAPFATPGAAYAYAQRYLDLNGFILTILCANTATYSVGVTCIGSIKGALSSDTVIFSFPSGGTFLVSTGTPCFNAQQGANFTVQGAPGNLLLLQANPTSGTASCITCVLGSNVQFAYINFGYAYFSQILVGNNSLLQAIGPCTISNQSQTFISATSFAYVRLTVAFTITGTPNYASCFAACSQSLLLFQGAGQMASFSGSATGSRYSIQGFGEIFTNGQATTFLPGDSAGTINNGVYA